MELIERPNLTAVKYLNTIKFDTFKSSCFHEAEINGEKSRTPKILRHGSVYSNNFVKQI